MVLNKLKVYGFEVEWSNAVCCIVDKLLRFELEKDSSFSLSQLESKERMNELEFYFPLKRISPKYLQDIFSKSIDFELDKGFLHRIQEINFSPLKGFMKGFIDLVFHANGKYYIIDWKTNYLGNSIENYDQKSMNDAMISNLYILQYHIYSVALNQYLKLRIPGYNYEQHFGGVFYIFLRGVEPELGNSYGLHNAKPSGKIISELTDKLIENDYIASSE